MQITEVKKTYVSAIALINDENEILIGKRPVNGFLPGNWEFPGGKIKKSECPELAIIRETKEEIGINLTKSCLAPLSFSTHQYNDFFIILLLYVARRWEGNPKPKTHAELRWVKANDLKKYNMPPANNYLVASLQDLLI